MQMTKQRKMLLSVLGTGLLALGLDRFVLAPPDSASADQPVPNLSAPNTPAPTPGTAQSVATAPKADAAEMPSYASLTDRLMAAQSLQAVQTDRKDSDPFSLPEGWRTQPAQVVSDGPVKPKEDPASKRLLEQYTLKGTSTAVDKDGKLIHIASVNSRLLRIGDSIVVKTPGAGPDGAERIELYELVRIDSALRMVEWRSHQPGEDGTYVTVQMHIADGTR